jgi:hypothetical protein
MDACADGASAASAAIAEVADEVRAFMDNGLCD